MASLHTDHAVIVKRLVELPLPLTTEGAALLEGYELALEHQRLRWSTSPLWLTETPRNDLEGHLVLIEQDLAQCVALGGRARATPGAAEEPAAAGAGALQAGGP